MKKVNNRKRLNNKGFTLVELLAVVVILALVMGIAASSMLNTMNSSRKSTLHSAAQTAASNLNNWIADDMLATTASEQKLGNTFITNTQSTNVNTWICLDTTTTISNKGTPATLVNVLGLSTDDIVISTVSPGSAGAYTIKSDDATVTNNTCSAYRYNSSTGGYEFLLVAKNGGKYYVAADGAGKNYAFSRAAGPNTMIND